MCDVLREMRDCAKTSNFSYLGGLIEEAQSMANRMESRLWDQKQFDQSRGQYLSLKEKVEEQRKKITGLEEALDANT
jgi:hypothetical protein